MGIGSVILASKIGLIVWYVSFLFICIFNFIAVFKLSVRRQIEEDPKNFWSKLNLLEDGPLDFCVDECRY